MTFHDSALARLVADGIYRADGLQAFADLLRQRP
jgi:hypothetical protein